MRYRVATRCQSCGEIYRSTAKEGKYAPIRCKNCKSRKVFVVEKPMQKHPEIFDIDQAFVKAPRKPQKVENE